MQNQTPNTIQATVNARLLNKAHRLFTGTKNGRIIEILQNARRAGATQVEITNQDGQITVRDNGRGIQDFAELLNLGGSGWLKLVGICEVESSKGLLVRTPHLDVIDLGTRFGVDATSPDRTKVEVFEGEVEASLATPTADQQQPLRLVAGQALAAQSNTGWTEAQSDPARFVITPRIEWLKPGLKGDRVIWLGQASGDLRLGQRESEDLQVYLERAGHQLDQDTVVDFTDDTLWSGKSPGLVAGTQRVIAGERVDVYLVHYDRLGVAKSQDSFRAVTLDFDRPILGVIADEATLRATDQTLGMVETQYPDLREIDARGLGQRGIDIDINDSAVLINQGRSIRINVSSVNYMDQVRVLVRANRSDESQRNTEPADVPAE